jgi:hypothetical protein
MDDGAEPLRSAIGAPADLIWASASVHHAADQQAAIDALASLLGPGGRLALAEGGLPSRNLPWDIGLGEPGLELRLDAAQDRWFKAMRESLPGSVPLPYGWTDALTRAGLTGVTTKSVLTEQPVPLSDEKRTQVIEQLRHRVARLTPANDAGGDHGHAAGDGDGHWHTAGADDHHDSGHRHGADAGAGDDHGHDAAPSSPTSPAHGHGHVLPAELMLSAEDLEVWEQLLDPDSEHFLGRRTDLAALSVRSIHLGQKPA